MGIFIEAAKCSDLVNVAKYYGVAVKPNGFINCIFHGDRHPSMKLYKDHYHCFGCGAHGDAVSFTSKLFGLSPYDAAHKLLEDFGFAVQSSHIHTDKISLSVRDAEILLAEYVSLLEEMRDDYCPASPNEEWHPLYAESIRLLPQYRYYLDTVTKGSLQERNEFVRCERRFFHELRANIRRARMAVRQRSDK